MVFKTKLGKLLRNFEVFLSLKRFVFVNMFNPFKKLKSKWERMWDWWHVKSPEEKWDSIINVAKVAGDLVGARMFGDIKKVDWYTGICGLMILIFFTTNIYTVQYYLLRNELVRGMECTYIVGVVVAVRMKILN